MAKPKGEDPQNPPKPDYNVSPDRSQREAQNDPDERTSPDHQPAHTRCSLWGSLQRFGELVRWCHPVDGLSSPSVQ